MNHKNFIIIKVTLLFFLHFVGAALNSIAQTTQFHFEHIYTIHEGRGGNPLMGQISDGVFDQKFYIYLLDNGNNQIHQFGPEGDFVQSFGREGRGPGEFLRAESIELDSGEQNLYVLDYPNSRIVGYDPSSGEHTHTINLSESGTPLNKLFVFRDHLMLLGNYGREDAMIHLLNTNGLVEHSFGEFIDFNSFIHRLQGKIQLSQLHTSTYKDLFLAALAAPNRVKLYDGELNLTRKFEDDLLPAPWIKHMIMRPDRYETTFHSMSINNQIVNNETYLFQWVDVIDPQERTTRRYLDLRSLFDGSLIQREELTGMFILNYIRVSDTSLRILVRNIETQTYEVYKLIIDRISQ